MKIAKVKELPNGVNGITIEGRIIKTPGSPRDSEFGWSQMVILKDDTAEIGSWINIESAETAYKVGQYLKVQGKVSKYVKGGKQGISLNNGKVLEEIIKDDDVSQAKPIEQPISQPTTQPITPPQKEVKREYTKDDYWYDKTLREIENNKCIVRECAIKAVSEQVARNNPFAITDKTMFFGFADEIIDYIYNEGKITSEDITREFGGTTREETKEERIEKAREIVKNTDPNMASQAQKDMVEKIIKSRYIKKEELDNISGKESKTLEEARVMALENINKITKVNADRYISYWFGNGEKIGERAERELIAKAEEEEEASPFITERNPIQKNDPNDDTSLTKDLLIEVIQKQRKELHLEDDEKFEKTIGYNPDLKQLTEEKLLKLKNLLKDWKPEWVK